MSHNWSKQGNASKRPFSSKHVKVDRIMKITQGKLSNSDEELQKVQKMVAEKKWKSEDPKVCSQKIKKETPF